MGAPVPRKSRATGAPRGRPRKPTKLTPDTILRICEAIRTTLPLEDCANRGGISFQCFRNWYKAGTAEYRRRQKDPARDVTWPRLTGEYLTRWAGMPAALQPEDMHEGERLYLAFFEEVTRANADTKGFVVGGIMAAGSPHTRKTTVTKTRQVVVDGKVMEVVDTEVKVEEGVRDVRALQWIAERRWPDDYCLSLLQGLDVDPTKLPDDVVDALAEGQKITRALRAERPEESVGVVLDEVADVS